MAAILHADALEPITTTCTACHGTGYAPIAYRAACNRCGASWTPARIAAHLDGTWGGWWGYRLGWLGDLPWLFFARLPCGCQKRHLSYHAIPCATCHGVGTFTHWQLSARYQQRQRAQLAATSARPQARRYPIVPPIQTTLTSRLATAPVSVYLRNGLSNWG